MFRYQLKAKILEVFEFQYLAARALGIRDDELSAFIKGRRKLSQKNLSRLRELLSLDESSFASLVDNNVVVQEAQ